MSIILSYLDKRYFPQDLTRLSLFLINSQLIRLFSSKRPLNTCPTDVLFVM
jgi:hypothetical protein